MKVKRNFKAALAVTGKPLHVFCGEINASHTQVYRILNAMESDPNKIPNTVEASRIVGEINKMITTNIGESVDD